MDNPEFWKTVGEIATYLTIGCGVVFLSYIKDWLKDWYARRRLHPIGRAVRVNRRIHNLLIELRSKTDADRALVFLFHNGQEFSNKNPLWRMSCTQEYCRDGISHEIDNLQNILASLFWVGIDPLFSDQLDDGIAKIAIDEHAAYVMDVVKMSDSYYKRSLIARGVKTNVITAIFDSRNNVVGYVALNFCEHLTIDQTIAKELIESAGNIYYELNKF